jgi:ABC-type Fe3+/spermidine/putrescine transport system ATPase subunit
MLEVAGIQHDYDGKPLLRGVNLTVAEGEIVCLLGASGSGKTTLLRIIAGLEKPDSGEVRLHDESLADVPVHARDFGFMFQDFALFPHLNVERNVAFGLRMRGWTPERQAARVREVLELVALDGFAQRDVTSLSGGERQRVALARSLAPNPRLLLLDEPLGALDAALRERLVVELRDIIKRAGLTAIYVTHDQQEAFAVSDRIAVLRVGQFDQVATPQELYRRPRTEFVARFLGFTNILPVQRVEAGRAVTAVGTFAVSGQPRVVLLHPDGLRVESAGALAGEIVEVVYRGDHYHVVLRHKSGQAISLDTPAGNDPAPVIGGRLTLSVAPESVQGLPALP